MPSEALKPHVQAECQTTAKLQVEVKGRAQQFDQTFCSRMNYMRLVGTPVYNILPCKEAADSYCTDLEITMVDLLEQQGGIRKCSENGRVAAEEAFFADFDPFYLSWLCRHKLCDVSS